MDNLGLGLEPLLEDKILDRLSAIWPEDRAELMRHHTKDRLANLAGQGEVLLISARRAEIIGITGWYKVPEYPDIVGLRWHGLLPEWRRRGVSRVALGLLAQRLAGMVPEAEWIFDVHMPDNIVASRHFRSIGFADARPHLTHRLLAVSGMPPDALPIMIRLDVLQKLAFPADTKNDKKPFRLDL